MIKLGTKLALSLALGFASMSYAQDTTTPETTLPETTAPAAEGDAPTADNLSLGETVGGIGSTYTESTHGDWEVRCERTEDGADPCVIYQRLNGEKGNPVAEITMFGLPEGQEAAAGATIITPLETLLTAQVVMQIDTSEPKRYPYTWCNKIGCIARVGFTAAEVEQFRKGSKATITIVPVGAPTDVKVVATISLKGFTAGYDAVNALNAPKAP